MEASVKRATKHTTATVIALIVGTAALSITSAKAGQGQSQAIEVSAKKYEFTPAEIHVKSGTHARLMFTATDHDHGVEFDVYPRGSKKKGEPGLVFSIEKPSFKLPKGEPQTIEFDARQPGTYEMHCAVVCGIGHHGMKGTIVVDP
jgi:cytochrome c oxidase subunit II